MKISSASEQVTTSKLLYIYIYIMLPDQSKFNAYMLAKRWLLMIQFYLLETHRYNNLY